MHTTNYFNGFIQIAEDSPVEEGVVPPLKGSKKSVANLQYEMLSGNPYRYTSDDVLFTVYARRKDIPEPELEQERQKYFSKGQPCFRASPLTKRYGWGIHSDEEGRIAMYGAETEDYEDFVKNPKLAKTKAMRSKRAK